MSYRFRKDQGFSILEMLISLSIITMILTVIVRGQSNFSESAGLQNAADQIALYFSQVQTFSLGVKEVTPGVFSSSFGMAFSTRAMPNGSTTAYIYFADRDNDSLFDNDWNCVTGGTSECLERPFLYRGNTISNLCIVPSSGADLCGQGRIDISFYRPRAEARFLFFDSGGNQVTPPVGYQGAKITLRSPSGTLRSISVYTTGQISVQ